MIKTKEYISSEQYRQMLVRDGDRRYQEWHSSFLKYQQDFLNQTVKKDGQEAPKPVDKIQLQHLLQALKEEIQTQHSSQILEEEIQIQHSSQILEEEIQAQHSSQISDQELSSKANGWLQPQELLKKLITDLQKELQS